MLRNFFFVTLGMFAAGCASSRSCLPLSDVGALPERVTAIVFMQRHGSNAQVVATVREPEGIDTIVRGIQLNREMPVSTAPFRHHAVFLQGTNECMHISFKYEPWSDRYFLRWRDKQYETDRTTYDLLAAHGMRTSRL